MELARSELCPYQAIRLRDKPVYGTQFHSEMNEERLRHIRTNSSPYISATCSDAASKLPSQSAQVRA